MGNTWLDRPDTSIFETAWNHLRQIHPELCIVFNEDSNPYSMVVSHDGTDATEIFSISLDIIDNTISYFCKNEGVVDGGYFDVNKDIRYLVDDLLILTGLGA